MLFIKAMLLGAILTVIVCLIVGSQGSAGGFLYIHPIDVPAARLHIEHLHNITFYWSWPMFFAGTGLAWAILLMLD